VAGGQTGRGGEKKRQMRWELVFETYKAVRGAVEAISANFVLCSKIEGEGVCVVLLWYRRVKGRVKHRHVGAGEQLLGLSDPDQIRRIVEGGKPRCIINRILHCLVHNDRAVEAVGAVHHTMADNADIRRVLRITIGRRGLASENLFMPATLQSHPPFYTDFAHRHCDSQVPHWQKPRQKPRGICC
jgi:hypothetical protein